MYDLFLIFTFIFLDTAAERTELSKYNIHAICGVLKLWFRELPEPLIPFELYDDIIKLERKFK